MGREGKLGFQRNGTGKGCACTLEQVSEDTTIALVLGLDAGDWCIGFQNGEVDWHNCRLRTHGFNFTSKHGEAKCRNVSTCQNQEAADVVVKHFVEEGMKQVKYEGGKTARVSGDIGSLGGKV